jgi:hypothetical protein
MKNLQKGFIVPLLIAIIAILVIGGGLYINSKSNQSAQKSNSQATQSESNSAPVQVQIPNQDSTSSGTGNSENESIIQGILNTKALLLSGDVVKIREYLQTVYADNSKFAAQVKSADDKTLLATAALLSKAMNGINETFLRTKCTIVITGNTAKCSWKPTPSNQNFNESITVKKINGVWQ